MSVFFTLIPFPKGYILLVKNKKRLLLSKYIKQKEGLEITLQELRDQSFDPQRDDSQFRQEITLFTRYFKGSPIDFTPIKLNMISGTPFLKKVWRNARRIPYGRTASYKELALRLKHKGYRSIGMAMGKNPFLIIVPCHRVIGSNNTLGGFSAGLDLKKYLLELEKIRL